VIVLLVVLYFAGVFGRFFHHDTKIEVNINKPEIVLQFRLAFG
jgi:hypothetical protein